MKNSVDFVERPIKEENPNEGELNDWIERSKYPIKKFFNTSGKLYKDLNLKKRLVHMPDEEQIKLLSTDGMLVKRPILISEKIVLVGFKEDEWGEKLL